MKRKRSTEEQIAFPLRQAGRGTAVEENCRKLGGQTRHSTDGRIGSLEWALQSSGGDKQVEDENAKPKRLVADLTLAKTMRQDMLRRQW
ncbi:hypothetical protein J5Y09_07300 [Roseomonas sp. PWR1]|uniref:Transposase n=1 Tax=Roseomonas nitratireducens TaxID=2820810 RepID=A0ABS4AQR4_9PROT|nr:hypothetical protein [Neoroseomonas nitratireducens]